MFRMRRARWARVNKRNVRMATEMHWKMEMRTSLSMTWMIMGKCWAYIRPRGRDDITGGIRSNVGIIDSE